MKAWSRNISILAGHDDSLSVTHSATAGGTKDIILILPPADKSPGYVNRNIFYKGTIFIGALIVFGIVTQMAACHSPFNWLAHGPVVLKKRIALLSFKPSLLIHIRVEMNRFFRGNLAPARS